MSITGELQGFDAGSWIELFVIELKGEAPLRFHAGTNGVDQPVVWQGNAYAPFPIQATGFVVDGSGNPPRPKLVVSNVTGLMTELARSFNNLLNARLTRQRTKTCYLDAANFADGNPGADPNAHLPDEVYYVAQKTSENKLQVEFELASALDLDGLQLPRRQIIANLCPWRYRGEECSYTGGPVADDVDQITNDPAEDCCGKRLSSCKLRFGENGELPFGGFPGASSTQMY
ncbi:phage minor tail protein L [Jeongeupia chitinilytica]|uniref:Minor tail fiber protein L n=1 Tax=Jeongeupia chitinilytica TaxID=1041641 RepID=A0ABQ3GX73_9NEIS|nr:phage minor tail protein L [Jeongeupia chitinilytica]GHD59540.1 minor tail fiber protein L [Jeongeupia chitinilytica]